MKKSSLTLALSAILPGLAFAAPPVDFGVDGSGDGTWSLDTLTQQIDHVCPSGFTCSSSPVADNNFLQVQMTENGVGGKTYFRTIIATDDTVGVDTDTFTSESFVVSGVTNGGISANQTMDNRQTNAGVLTSSTTLNTGSFNNGSEDQVTLTQDVWDAATTPEFHAGFGFTKNSDGSETSTDLNQQIVVPGEFSDEFTSNQIKDGAGVVLSGSLDIVSGVVLNTPGGTLTDQTFNYSLREGGAVSGAGQADFTAGTVDWIANEKVDRVLVGQSVTSAGDFGYERVADLTNAEQLTEFSLASVGPFSTISGVDPFGTPGVPTDITVVAP